MIVESGKTSGRTYKVAPNAERNAETGVWKLRPTTFELVTNEVQFDFDEVSRNLGEEEDPA